MHLADLRAVAQPCRDARHRSSTATMRPPRRIALAPEALLWAVRSSLAFTVIALALSTAAPSPMPASVVLSSLTMATAASAEIAPKDPAEAGQPAHRHGACVDRHRRPAVDASQRAQCPRRCRR